VINAMAAGTYLGLLMASIGITLGALMLFSYVRRPSPGFASVASRFPPSKMVVYGVVLSYLLWTVLGFIAGVAYWGFAENWPGRGLASPNGAYTTTILILGILGILPIGFFLRRVLPGVFAVFLIFIGLYGWALPYFAE